MAINKTTGKGVVNGYKIRPAADLNGVILADTDLSGANLKRSSLREVDFTKSDLTDANLSKSVLKGAYFNDAILIGANFTDANLMRADLSGANLTNALLGDADLREADLSGAILIGANFTGADLIGADLSGAIYDENIKKAYNLDDTIGYNLRSAVKSYGAMTGPILKLGKPDSPAKAAEFKRLYPAEFERLKSDTGGRDFTESMKDAIREKYATPFDWVIKRKKYISPGQRLSGKPNLLLLLCVNLENPKYTDKLRDILYTQAKMEVYHPHTRAPLFAIGWVRYDKNDKEKVLLIEEVQSDIDNTYKKLKRKDSDKLKEKAVEKLREAGIEPKEFMEAAEIMRPYSDRLYEDAIGLIFQEAEALGYTVEMLSYETKKEYDSPVSTYTDLPKRLGMTARRGSESLYYFDRESFKHLPAPVRYYKPNPGKPKGGF
jgi:hypothetical protein